MLYLVRHGQTDWNLFGRFNGVTDTYLNQTGITQAERLAEKLRGVCFDACFCSPLTRARRFCEIIYGGEAVYDGRLAEIDCGEFEGAEENAESIKAFFRAASAGERGTERFADFISRNCELCGEIMDGYGGKNVLIVTHAANARVIDYYFKGKPADYDFTQRVAESGGMITYEL